MSSLQKTRIMLSGIQPTGIPHLGNYLGALINWAQLQDDASPEGELLSSIVGWHAMTLPQGTHGIENGHNDVHVWIRYEEVFSVYEQTSRLAVSKNLAEDAEMDETGLNVGLFTYPVLMSVDIALQMHVPVGDDQTQHLELCRDLADQFDRTYKAKHSLFPLPIALTSGADYLFFFISKPPKRILSLRDPTSKMSKSSPDPASRILFTDSPSEITSKIHHRSGTANLLTILAACTGEYVHQIAKRFEVKNYGVLKSEVTGAVQEISRGPRDDYERLKGQKDYLLKVAKEGAERAGKKAEATMRGLSCGGLHSGNPLQFLLESNVA
ncbi:Nucleotidylyl transferase [Dendrothele bispora CBS 962.96]|uniref:tryptophan--tRNA ligase n=1 Tax=Dendrothele bispora (strain CBS 962.96) TaxID=1314807 RepID=A0A4S8LI41_DENBC|nr:Nucleotidylyl transferase [Dendrothele bispora CBS 962.96]